MLGGLKVTQPESRAGVGHCNMLGITRGASWRAWEAEETRPPQVKLLEGEKFLACLVNKAQEVSFKLIKFKSCCLQAPSYLALCKQLLNGDIFGSWNF